MCLVSAHKTAALLALWTALLAVSCAKKPVAPPPLTGTRFPDFVFPAVPQAIGTPELIDAHQLAWQILQSGNTRDAARSFSALLKQTPAFYPAEAGLGYTELAQKDAQAAVTHFDRALARDPGYTPALIGKGDALLSSGRTAGALEAFEAALKADPTLSGLRGRVDVLRARGVQQAIETARKAADAGKLEDARRAYEAAIAASPESAFLYRELAVVDRRAGDLDAALTHAERAAQLDPADARAVVVTAEIYETQGAWAKAADAYAAASVIEPSDALNAKADAMRDKASFETMPEEYRSIETSPTVTRAQLAALLGVRLEDLLRHASSTNAALVTDTRGNWAAPWIFAVVRSGVLEAYPNHTFQPNGTVRRGDLARAVSRVLTLIGAEHPGLASKWRDPRPRFADISPAHLSYPAAARAVSAGIMDMLENNTFQLSRTVTGAEAVQAVARLEALAKGGAR
jgi:tetratricopeptide (TPR) repeat protein